MILCLCSAISDRHVRQAAEAGVTRWRDVFRRQQAAPKCGACVDIICEILESENTPCGETGALRRCG
jgi:bacterioferritin-associated ferredoxin